MQILPNGLTQSGDALNDLLLGHAGIVQAQGVVVTAVGEEGAAGNEGHLLGKALHLQILGVHVLRLGHSGDQAPLGTGVCAL